MTLIDGRGPCPPDNGEYGRTLADNGEYGRTPGCDWVRILGSGGEQLAG